MEMSADRLRKARIARGYETAADAARAFGWNVNTYSSNENGNATFSFRKAEQYAAALGVRAEWLYSGEGAQEAARATLVSIVGYVGADTEGSVLFTNGQGTGEMVPIPPGGTVSASALGVRGHSMKGFADDGALIFFEERHSKPTRDMLSHVVVVETMDGRVLVKRLLKGSHPGVYDLESLVGPTLEDVDIRWAAIVTAIVPPAQARKIIVRNGDNQAA